eukprot:gene24396-29492_t
MQLIFLQDGGDPVAVEVPDDSDTDLLYQIVAAEISSPPNKFVLFFNDIPLESGQILLNLGIIDGSTLGIQHKKTKAPSIYEIPANTPPDQLMSLTRQHPELLRQFLQHDPELGSILQSEDLSKLRLFLMKRFMQGHKAEYAKQQDLKALEADPMNPELQKKIEEQIRLENIQENMAAALDHLPEAFGRVTMLYVNIEVNGVPVKAFVDSGAQSTIMSVQCAERCGITRLIDTRFSGEARGVGTARIVGRVHIAQMKFGESVFPISITVLENNDVDFLFGLDTLRRYRCMIDLSKDVLRIEGVRGVEEVRFLSEAELPEHARGTLKDELDKQQGPQHGRGHK